MNKKYRLLFSFVMIIPCYMYGYDPSTYAGYLAFLVGQKAVNATLESNLQKELRRLPKKPDPKPQPNRPYTTKKPQPKQNAARSQWDDEDQGLEDDNDYYDNNNRYNKHSTTKPSSTRSISRYDEDEGLKDDNVNNDAWNSNNDEYDNNDRYKKIITTKPSSSSVRPLSRYSQDDDYDSNTAYTQDEDY